MKNLISASLISFVGAFYEKIENDPRARPGAGSLVCNKTFISTYLLYYKALGILMRLTLF